VVVGAHSVESLYMNQGALHTSGPARVSAPARP
jgi:hypothetical protein